MDKHAGYSLLELLTVLAILLVLAGAASPGLAAWWRDQHNAQVMRQYGRAIKFMRSAAVTRHQVVTLCRSADGRSCEGLWEDGAIVFADANANARVDEADEVLRRLPPNRRRGTIRWRVFQNRQYLQITPLGFTNSQNGNFTFCPEDGEASKARQLVINRAGRLRVAVDTDGDGIREDSAGQPLTCP